MEERDLAELRGMVQTYYTLPQVRAIWESQRGWMAADFEAFVDEAIAEVDEGRAPAFRGHSSVGELASKLDELGIGVPLGAQARPGRERRETDSLRRPGAGRLCSCTSSGVRRIQPRLCGGRAPRW